MMDSFPNQSDFMPVLDGTRYFYNKHEHRSFVPRLEITLRDPIILSFLQTAAEKAMGRYRHLRLVVKSNEHDYYLVDNNRPPVVHVDNGQRHIVGTEENNGHLTWIGMHGNTIIIEFFHGISDGHGTLPFIEYLLRCYCSLRYNVTFQSSPSYFTLQEDSSEYMDCLSFVDNTQHLSLPNTSVAFQLPEEQMDSENTCAVYSLKVDASAFDSYMRQNRSSRSSVFALFMNHVIASIHPEYDAPIVAGIAADVRKIYGAENTLRDCSDILNIPFDQEINAMPIAQQLQLMRQMIVDNMQPDIRLAHAAQIKNINALLAKKCPMLEDKKRFCKRLLQYNSLNHTYGLSNVGLVSFGEELDAYVECVEAFKVTTSAQIIMAIYHYKQTYNIVYCTHFKNDPYVYEFQQSFIRAGIPCTCERRSNYSETLAVF